MPRITLRGHAGHLFLPTIAATNPYVGDRFTMRNSVPVRCGSCSRRVYRNEDVTARSRCISQVEGLMVGPDVRMSDLKGVLLHRALLRWRASRSTAGQSFLYRAER